MKSWRDQFGRVCIANLNEKDLLRQTEDCLFTYEKMIENMVSNPELPTWANTYHVLEIAISGVSNFNSALAFLAEIGTFDSSSAVFSEASEKIGSFFSNNYKNRKIPLRLHQLKRQVKLSPARLSILESTIASYNESFHSTKNKEKINKVTNELAKYELEFLNNIKNARQAAIVHFATITHIKSVPEYMRLEAKEKAKSLGMQGYAFSLESVNYVVLMQECTSRKIRKEIYYRYVQLASNHKIDNAVTLKKLIFWRNKQAKMYGYQNYADYAASNSGLHNVGLIDLFLDNLKDYFEEENYEHSELIKQYAKDFHNMSTLQPWDRHFVKESMNQYLMNKYELSAITINFKLACKEMFNLAHKLFGLTFEKTVGNEYKLWDKKAICYKVADKNGLVGHLVFDIFKRENKPQTLIFQYTLNTNMLIEKKRVPSQQAIVMHLDDTSVFDLDDMENLYHEFGHALHLLLTQKQYHVHHAFAIEKDAIEFPSQWFERFVKNPTLISKVAFQDNKNLSIEKAEMLLKVNDFYKPLQYWTSILHSKIDIYLNSQFKPTGSKTFHDALEPIFSSYNQTLPKYNMFQNNQFEHFYMGATYYGYLWAEHMIEVWVKEHGDKELSEQGELFRKLLNGSTEKRFNEQFKKLVKNPYNEQIGFEKNSPLKSLLSSL